MNTQKLAMRLCEDLKYPDLDKLPLREGERLREAMGKGLQAFAQLLPSHRQTQTMSETLRAPLTQDIDIVNGSREFVYVAGGSAYPKGGYAKEADALGLLAVVSGEVVPNRLMLPGELLRPYVAGGGNQKMTLFGDAVRMGGSVWQVIGNPTCTGSGFISELVPLMPNCHRPTTLETGAPRYWWAESLAGATRASNPIWIMRVWPVPAAVSVIEFQVSAFPQAVSFLDIHDEPRALPNTDEEEPFLIALCEEALITHPLFREDIDKSAIRWAADNARSALSARNRPMTTTPNTVGTPKGW